MRARTGIILVICIICTENFNLLICSMHSFKWATAIHIMQSRLLGIHQKAVVLHAPLGINQYARIFSIRFTMHTYRYSVVSHSQGAHKLTTRGSIKLIVLLWRWLILNYAEISNSEPTPSDSILLANVYYIHQFSLDGTRERTVASSPTGGIWGIDYHYRWLQYCRVCNSMRTSNCLQ